MGSVLDWVLTRRIDTEPFMVVVDVIALVGIVVLTVRRPFRRRIVLALGVAALCALAGLIVAWLVSDVWDVFGIALTSTTRMWTALAFAGVGAAVVGMWGARLWRVVTAAVCIPVVLFAAAVGINADFGAFRTLSDAFGLNTYPTVTASSFHGHARSTPNFAKWRAPANMPKTGIVETVAIPGTTSHFVARKATIYLPPAARVAHAPALPVVVGMSGQPGAPNALFAGSNVDGILNAYAAKHKGLAPILVEPDQLGKSTNNPMCVDSPLGNSATYITVDVVHWIKTHLNVIDSPSDWAVAGFSQGATCAIQFGAARPDLFDTIISVSSELTPTIGVSTVARGFGGSVAAFDAAKPVAIMQRQALYAHTTLYLGVGQNDAKYRRFDVVLRAAARQAGMTVHAMMSPGTSHDWHTVSYVLKRALPAAADAWGLNQ